MNPTLRWPLIILGCSLLALTACSRRVVDTTPTTNTPAAAPTAASGAPSVDCTTNNPACPAIVIAGDPPAPSASGTNGVGGYADPSIRRDPVTGALWMAYSWPHRQTITDQSGKTTGTVVAVDSHLARSNDGGATWQFVTKLWTSAAEVSDTGELGWRNQEVVSLASNAAGTQWYSARESYLTRVDGGPKLSSFTLRIATAASPDKLAQSEEEILGGALTAAFWQPDQNLSSLSSQLTGCVWRDPGILVHDTTLYLAVECSLFTQTGERTADEFVGVFATQPQGSPKTWKWRFIGKLTSPADATALGGEMLEQTELDVARDGLLIAIFSPSKPSSPLATHYGCKVVEVASIDPPALVRDAAGQPNVLASVTASDVGPYGPAACTYDPASSTGVVLARRVLDPGLTFTLNSTGLLK
jgi:hypothetical protein